jgi:hypothetical protein
MHIHTISSIISELTVSRDRSKHVISEDERIRIRRQHSVRVSHTAQNKRYTKKKRRGASRNDEDEEDKVMVVVVVMLELVVVVMVVAVVVEG